MKAVDYCNVSSQKNNPIKLIHYDETKKDAQVRAKENIKLSHGRLSQRPASDTNQPIKDLRQSHQWVWGLTHRRAIKVETIAIKCNWVYNQTCRLSHDIHVTSNVFEIFDYRFE